MGLTPNSAVPTFHWDAALQARRRTRGLAMLLMMPRNIWTKLRSCRHRGKPWGGVALCPSHPFTLLGESFVMGVARQQLDQLGLEKLWYLIVTSCQLLWISSTAEQRAPSQSISSRAILQEYAGSYGLATRSTCMNLEQLDNVKCHQPSLENQILFSMKIGRFSFFLYTRSSSNRIESKPESSVGRAPKWTDSRHIQFRKDKHINIYIYIRSRSR